ncbi:glucosyltransferase domain-containing protein [Rhodanobacter sp. C03]|uniref:glucosyltransferase domain-containing protein n=1 Tax=Rhodanobacter sp. C03 TaxID=1945858 RepID=UPI00143B864E|nr:glucosyltransferase domain-containing protein [Rhodanobacter sp. C03]
MSQSISSENPGGLQSGSARGDHSVFAILLALYFLILYPILRANRYYDDDLKRALVGHSGWDSNGRPLTTLLMKLLQCYDAALVDISPLTQIGAIAMLAWVGVLIGRRYAIRSPWLAALVAFPLGAQPFYLENLSYKFDALSMSAAMLLALLPMIALKDDRRGWWLGVLALFASLCFYQPAINACLIFILLEVLLAQLSDSTPRQLMLPFLWRAWQAGLAVLVYQLVVGIHIHGWVGQQSEKIHGLRDLPVLKTNIVDFYTFIGDSFNQQWWRYFTPVLILLALVPVAIGIRYALRIRRIQPAWVSALLFALSLLLPLAALACVFGPMLLLLRPEIEPRVLMGVGALLAAALIAMQAALRQWRWSDVWTLSVSCMLALGMCVIASAYGNALGEQKGYEDRIAAHLAEDLAELKVSHSIHSFLLDGSIGYAPVAAHVAEQIPLVHTLIIPYISVDDAFHTHMFLMYYLPEVADLRFESGAGGLQQEAALLAETCRMPAVLNTRFYRLYLVDDIAVLSLRPAGQQRCVASAPPVTA